MENFTQWQRLLMHLGAWQGSFTRLSPQGKIIEDTPTIVQFEGINNNETMRQTLQYFSPETGDITQEKVLEYRSLNRSILFFEDGTFSLGSIQFNPLAEFGTEIGFIQGDRRLRLVQLFQPQEGNSSLSQLTLIREKRQGTSAADRSPLTIDLLLGEWQGKAVTLYPDWRSPDRFSTRLDLKREGDQLLQTLSTEKFQLASRGTIHGDQILFEQTYPIQVLLFPDGASSNTPLIIPKGKPFLLEAGWLVEPNLRKRVIRSYDDRGGWASLTLVTERKLTSL